MTEPTPHLSRELPPETRDYLAHRLDGARDLYLLALALGDRPDGSALFGRMIREARIHFAAVIEEARIAGLDTGRHCCDARQGEHRVGRQHPARAVDARRTAPCRASRPQTSGAPGHALKNVCWVETQRSSP